MSEWSADYERVVRQFLPLLDEEAPLDAEASLLGLGLDSLATVQLLVTLEDEFGVSFPDELLTPETFSTPAELWRVLSKLSASGI